MGLSTDIENNISRCRIVLSLVALVVVSIDPTTPSRFGLLPPAIEELSIDPYAIGALVAHLAYSLTVYYLLTRGLTLPRVLTRVTTVLDVLFGALIVACTEGTASPFWAFFVFGVIAAGAHGDFRRSMGVTGLSAAIYVALVCVAWHDDKNFFLMRPVYLAVVGYLTAYLGQRLMAQARLHEIDTMRQRNRIARALHDGCVQTLGGVNLTLGICKELVAAGRRDDALARLTVLQESLNREHDELRTYVRELVDLEPTRPQGVGAVDTRVIVSADFAGSPSFVDQVLQLVREAVTNVRRHAHASAAVVSIRAADSQVMIAVDDDGVGFAHAGQIPWSISSRVTDAGGVIQIVRELGSGAHVRVALPEG